MSSRPSLLRTRALTHWLGKLKLGMQSRLPLSEQRRAMYPYTRPAFVVAGLGTGSCLCLFTDGGPAPIRHEFSVLDRLSLLPLAIAGAHGASLVLSRRGGFSWLSHAYERYAWAGSFLGLSAAALAALSVECRAQCASLWAELQQRSTLAVCGGCAPTHPCLWGSARVHPLLVSRTIREHDARGCMSCVVSAAAPSSEPPKQLPLGPSCACALAATAGERLGGAMGRFLLLPALGVSALCVADHFVGDGRAERVLQGSVLALLPLLHLLPPVHTNTMQALLSSSWFAVAAGFHFLSERDAESSAFLRRMAYLMLGFGAASLQLALVKRVPICQY